MEREMIQIQIQIFFSSRTVPRHENQTKPSRKETKHNFIPIEIYRKAKTVMGRKAKSP